MGWRSLTSKVGMTTSVSVSHILVWPSMFLILPCRYLPLYRGRLNDAITAASALLLTQLTVHQSINHQLIRIKSTILIMYS